MPQKRPFGVTLFLWMVLFLSAWGVVRLLAALRWWQVLAEFDARLSPLYLFLTGAGWAVAGVLLFWGVWAGKRWIRLALPISILVWLAEYWLERIFFQAPRANLGFMVLLSILMIVMTLAITFNRNTRNFLIRSEAHEQPDQDQFST